MGESRSPDAQAEAALAILDDVARITADPGARAEVNPLLKRLGLWIGLRFRSAIKGTKRVVQQLASGRMVFGDGRLPVPLFGEDNVENWPHGCACASPAPPPTKESNQNQEVAPSCDSAGATLASAVSDENGRAKKQTAEAGVVPVPAAVLGDRTPG